MNTIGILSVTCLISALILSIIVATAAPTSSQKLIPDENSIDSNFKNIFRKHFFEKFGLIGFNKIGFQVILSLKVTYKRRKSIARSDE